MSHRARTRQPGLVALALAAATLAVLGTCAATIGPARAGSEGYAGIGGVRTLCDLSGSSVDESSGLAASRRHRGVLWTHNDSKSPSDNRIVGIDVRRGCSRVATISVRGAENRDWEDIAIRRGRIWIGNIGGAGGARYVARVDEPRTLGRHTRKATVYRIAYAGGREFNAEALMVRPSDARVFIATKEAPGVSGLWMSPATLRVGRTNTFSKVASTPGNIGSGDWAPGGRYYLLASTNDPARVYVYRARTHRLVGTWAKPHAGESIAWKPGGLGFYFGHEGSSSDIYFARVYHR